jgi:hypothetical protein
MPSQHPSSALSERLLGIGLEIDAHDRRALRSIIHTSTGMPPDETLSADDLAIAVIELHRLDVLRRPPIIPD